MTDQINLDQLEASTLEQSKSAETLSTADVVDLLAQATHENVEVALSPNLNVEKLGKESQQSIQELSDLEPQLSQAEQLIESQIDQSFPDTPQDIKDSTISTFRYIDDLDKINTLIHSFFEDQDSDEVDQLIENLLSQQIIQDYHTNFQKSADNKKTIAQAKSKLDQVVKDQLQIEYFHRSFTKRTGINLQSNQTTTLSYKYQNPEGQEVESELTITGLHKDKDGNAILSIKYIDPTTQAQTELNVTSYLLENIISASEALPSQITNQKDLDQHHLLTPLGLSFQVGPIDYIADGQASTLEILKSDDTSLELSESVELHGESKSTLSLNEFSKWANLNNAMPQLSKLELEQAVKTLPQSIQTRTGIPAENLPADYQIQTGSTFISQLDNSIITVQELSDTQIKYIFNNTERTKPNSLFLKQLSEGLFVPIKTPHQEPANENTEAEPSTEKPQTTDEQPISSKESDETSESSELKINFQKGGPSLLSPAFYTGLIQKGLTLNGNVIWMSYTDYSDIINAIVDNYKSSLSISRRRSLGTAFKNHPLIGESMARLDQAAKGEIRDDHKQYLERVGDWPQWQEEAFTQSDPVKFFATCSLLSDNGYLPVTDPRFINNVNKFASSIGKKVVQPTADNGPQVAEQLIDVFDALSGEKGTGSKIVTGNKSNMDSAVSRFKNQSSDTFNNNTDYGLYKLNKLIKQYKETNNIIDPHEFSGMILAAIESGNVDTLEIMNYLGMAAGIKRNGEYLIKDFGFLDPMKKNFVPGSLFLFPKTLNEIRQFYGKEFSNYNLPKNENIKANFSQRIGPEKAQKLTAFTRLLNTTGRAIVKSTEPVDEGILDNDHGAFGLYVVNHDKFHNTILYQSRTTRQNRALHAKNGRNAMNEFLKIMGEYKTIFDLNGANSFPSDKGNYQDIHEVVKNSMKVYISLESGLLQRAKLDSRSVTAPLVSENELTPAEKKRIEDSKFLIETVLKKADPSINTKQLLHSDDLTPEEMYKAIQNVFQKVSPADIEAGLKECFTYSQEKKAA